MDLKVELSEVDKKYFQYFQKNIENIKNKTIDRGGILSAKITFPTKEGGKEGGDTFIFYSSVEDLHILKKGYLDYWLLLLGIKYDYLNEYKTILDLVTRKPQG